MRATVQWSYELLTEDEQRLFRHLSVFVDGVDIGTAEEVASDLGLPGDPGSPLAHLVDASMIDAVFEGRTRYRMLETLRAFGLDRLAAAGEVAAAERRLLRWAVRTTAWIDATIGTEREPDADAVLRREVANLRDGWRLARRQPSVDEAVAMVTALGEVAAWRDLTEIRGWAAELVEDPRLDGHPAEPLVLGVAAEAAYDRGDYPRADQLALAGLERAAGDAKALRVCLTARAMAALSGGAFADVVEHALAAAAVATLPTTPLGLAGLAATYAGDLDRARELNDRMTAAAVSPSGRAFAAYLAGEIDSAAGQGDRAEEHYATAIELAHSSGATFIIGIASVGLLTVRADSGRVHDALRGYRDVIGYFARTGNWTHQWVTMRNLAQLLRRLGDDEPAALLDAAASRAPDAPPADPPAAAPPSPAPGRARVLEIARQAIERNLAGQNRAGRPSPTDSSTTRAG